MQKVKENIVKLNPKCDVVIIKADFENNTRVSFYETTVMDKIRSLDIGIAIVNAGVFPLGTYDQLTNQEVQSQIDVNVYQYGILGKMFTDHLIKRED